MVALPKDQTQTPSQLAIELATRYQKSIIPVDETKKTPLLGFLNKKGEPARLAWKQHQTKRATAKQIDQWQEKFNPMAWAMVTGAISGVVTFDWDGPEGEETRKRLGIPKHRITGSGGSQTDFPHPGWPVKSVNHKTSAAQQWTQDYPGLDIRGDGGIALVAGRNEKGPYIWIRKPDDLVSLDILPTDLRESLGLLHPPEEKPAKEPKVKAPKSIPDYGPSQDPPTPIAKRELERHLDEINMMGGRDIACFLLACQLRDNNYSQSEADGICEEFARRAPLIDQHGNLDPFTEAMARAKVTSAYSYPKRDPWAQQKPSERKEEIIIKHIVPHVSREEHERLLHEACLAIRIAIREHITRDDGTVLLIIVPPGVGKSHIAADLARDEFIVAWMAQSHKMAESIDALQAENVKHIQPCDEDTCSHYKLHHILGKKRINTYSIHSKHDFPCDHVIQFEWTGTTVFMQQYIKSGYPAQKQAIIVDEVNISDWLPEIPISIATLHKMLLEIKSTECFEDLFIRALQSCITDCAQSKKPIDGSAVFDRLNKNDQLVNWLSVLGKRYAKKSQLYLEIDDIDDRGLERTLDNHAPYLLPMIIKAFLFELVRWQKGELANSRIRIGPYGTDYSLFISEPIEFVPNRDTKTIPPIILLDATGDESLYTKMLDKTVTTLRIDVPCAPGTRHIAVRTGKRYGITSLTSYNTEDLDRAIREVRYVLREHVDKDGSLIATQQVGLITFKDCRENMANALGIPSHLSLHFSDLRGKNDLRDCSVLLVVGTPMPPVEIERQTRVLSHDILEPIACDPNVWKEKREFSNPHVQQFATFLTNAELTQAAHRNRPIRFEDRTIITFCMGDVDFLPINEELIQFPSDITKDGQNESIVRDDVRTERMKTAHNELTQEGKKVTITALAERAKVRNQTAKQWLDENKQKLDQNRSANPNVNITLVSRNDFGNFDATDLPHYKGIEKGARVTTPKGQGVVNRIVPILGVRIVVYLDKADTRGISMHTFAWNEVHPIVDPSETTSSERFNAALDELFA